MAQLSSKQRCLMTRFWATADDTAVGEHWLHLSRQVDTDDLSQCEHTMDGGGQPNGLRLSCGAVLCFSQTQFYPR